MFIDLLKIKIKAGDGGDGLVSFRREKYVNRGGPDGGDGGDGGSVIFKALSSEYDLAKYNFLKLIKADNGAPGGRNNRRGKSGQDVIVSVPQGTILMDSETDDLIADLIDDGQTVMVAKGGEGGFGNAHFKSSVHRAPLVAERGLKGWEKILKCELKLLAEVGLVGLPNAGKSTFLRSVTRARPKVGAYPFTTLEPHLGVSSNGCLIADIPGLIEGAAEGKGLGHQFLRHVERNLVILHLIDCQQEDPITCYRQINKELEAYNPKLLERIHLLALTKAETLSDEERERIYQKLRKEAPLETKIYEISSFTQLNLDLLLKDLKKAILKARADLAQAGTKEPKEKTLPIFKMKESAEEFTVSRKDGDCFLVCGLKIERFALKTDFANFHARQRLLDIMMKLGVIKRLMSAGYENELIVFGMEEVGGLRLSSETEDQNKEDLA